MGSPGRARAGALVSLALVLAACGGATASLTTSAVATPSAAAVAVPSPSESAPDASVGLPSDSPSDAPADTPAPIDPCSLITRAEANAVAGVKTGDPLPAGDPAVRCVWPTPTSGAVGQVEIDVGDGAKKAYDIDHDVLQHTFKPVPGLGDEAYSEESYVFFRKGDLWIAIHVVRLDDPKTWMPKVVALAETVAGRLP